MAIIGLDIGGTKLLGALFDKNRQIIDKEKRPSKGEEGIKVFIKQIDKVIDQLIKRNNVKIDGIGVGVPGTVDHKGIILFSPNLPLDHYDLAKHLTKRYKVPVRIGNDVNLGTYGEYSEMNIKHYNVIGLFPGTGLGGGIIINEKLYIGSGSAGELGHIVVQKDGVLCGCGNHGCLESYASKKGIISYIKTELDKGRSSVMAESVLEGVIKSSKLKQAYDEGDELTVEAMNQFVEYLGMGVGIIINIFNPNQIIIGGGIIESFGEELLKGIKTHAKHHAMTSLYEDTEITTSKLGDDAVIYGAYHLIKRKLNKDKKKS
jgi:glucokinase